MKNWKQIASGHALAIPDDQFARIAPPLDALEAAFRPLLARLPLEVEPAIILSPEALDPQ